MDSDLIASLREAKSQFLDSPKLGANAALACVVDFLKRGGVPPDLLEPLTAIRVAFADLERGAENALMVRTKLPHRPPESYVTGTAKGCAAAAMELLIQSGMGRTEAARYVAAKIKKWPWGKTSAVTATIVERWRDAARSGCDDKDMDRTMFLGATTHEAVGTHGPRAWANHILLNPVWVNRPQDSK